MSCCQDGAGRYHPVETRRGQYKTIAPASLHQSDGIGASTSRRRTPIFNPQSAPWREAREQTHRTKPTTASDTSGSPGGPIYVRTGSALWRLVLRQRSPRRVYALQPREMTGIREMGRGREVSERAVSVIQDLAMYPRPPVRNTAYTVIRMRRSRTSVGGSPIKTLVITARLWSLVRSRTRDGSPRSASPTGC